MAFKLLPAGRKGKHRFGYQDPKTRKMVLVSQGGWNSRTEAKAEADRVEADIVGKRTRKLEDELREAERQLARTRTTCGKLQSSYDSARHSRDTARLGMTTAVVISIGLAVALVWALTGTPFPDLNLRF
ncbi:MAG: hypothetical protein OXH56_01905 [Gemmatimonadetes bacterium]|nr:hypothetical protein [Gemmatimonadota bacterium]